MVVLTWKVHEATWTGVHTSPRFFKFYKDLLSNLSQSDVLAAPQGFEPRYADPESAVLPLNEGAEENRASEENQA